MRDVQWDIALAWLAAGLSCYAVGCGVGCVIVLVLKGLGVI